ncbi:MAG: energy transducer TonB [Ignavibacteria bacterium]|nr:energy transducer TonB [Ignavibacteria bacterium]
MKKLFFLVFFFSGCLCLFSQNNLDEIKIGIYAKDHSKIYKGLSNHFGDDFSAIHPNKFVEFANWLLELEDYSSAYQFFMIANVSAFFNGDMSLEEKNSFIKNINSKCDSLIKKITQLDRINIEKNKYNIFPGKINFLNNLAIMLKNSERIKFDAKPSNKVRNTQEGIAPIQIETISGGIQLAEEKPEIDEAPFYDYRDIIDNLVYPQKAKEQKIEGTVTLEIVLNELGNVVEKKVISSDNDIFNSYALNVIDYVKFRPAKRSGKPVHSKLLVPIHFINK